MKDDAQIRAAFELLVPQFEGVDGDWDDALRRGGIVGIRPRTRARRRRALVAVALAAACAVVLVAGALGNGVVHRTLDQLGAWVGATPGTDAPAEEQTDFQKQNEQAYTHFPPGTKVGLLVETKYRGETYDLLGFRDGPSLCLRLVRAGGSTSLPADCAPQPQLVDLGRPAAVVNGKHPLPAQDPVATAVYGLAADDVTRVDVETAKTGRHEATVARNAFLYVGPPVTYRSPDDRGDAATEAVVTEAGGSTSTIPISIFPPLDRRTAEDLPGPAKPEYGLTDSRIRWLEAGEARGDPFPWPGNEPPVEHAWRVRPNPDSSFELGVGFAPAADAERNGDWYCIAWLWPLTDRSLGYGCVRSRFGDTIIESTGPSGGEQFPLYVGFAADAVARMELFFANGARENVPITDNVYAVTVPQSMGVKLVSYDTDGRVVGVHVLGF